MMASSEVGASPALPSAPPVEEATDGGDTSPLGTMEEEEVAEEEAVEGAVGGAGTETEDKKADEEEEEEEGQKAFECNICLDVARDAVISLCGHLFCWPCLHQWLETRRVVIRRRIRYLRIERLNLSSSRPHRQICPVCKAGISRDKVIPLYGRGNTDQKDPRDKVRAPPTE